MIMSISNVLRLFVTYGLWMVSNASKEPVDAQSVRQIVTQNPILPPNIGGAIGNILPAILPFVLILGLGAFLLPAIGILLFGSTGGLGGFFDGFSKKRSLNKNGSIFSSEKMVELIHTITKAIEELSKEN